MAAIPAAAGGGRLAGIAARAAHSPGVHRSDRDPATASSAGGVLLREVAFAALSVGAVTIVLALLMGTGILPDPRAGELARSLAFLYTPLSLLAAAGLYGLLARAQDGGEATPSLRPRAARAGFTLSALTVLSHTALAILGSYAVGILLSFLGAPVSEQATILEITAEGLGLRAPLVLLAVSALIAAPIAEELLLRGLFFRRLALFTDARLAYAASALAFAAIHGNWTGLFVYVWLGLCFAHAYARTGRLSCAILTHAGNNAITLGLLLQGSPPA